mgnify:FL=1
MRVNLSRVKMRRMPRQKPPPKPYHHGNLRESLLAAADDLLSTQGLQGLTLREVARKAGVSHAAPYHHFASLDELLAAVAGLSFARLGADLAVAAGNPDPRAALLDVNDAYVRHARRYPAQFRLMFGPMLARKAEFPEFAQAARLAFERVLEVGERFVPGDGARVALAGWSLAHGFSHLAIDGALDDLPVNLPIDVALARSLADLLLPSRPTSEPVSATTVTASLGRNRQNRGKSLS